MEWDETQASSGHAQTMLATAEAYCSVCESSFAPGTDVCPADGTRLVQFQDKSDHLIGRVIDGRFEVLERLGHGGMGDVYRARQRSVGREVAIKVIKPALSADRTAAKRFLREAKLLSRVSQANVVMVHDTGQDEDGTLYLVMELVDGHTLTSIMHDARGLMPGPRIVDIALQICDALEAAHRTGIIHRDLKPSNILIKASASGRDTVKVLDFGLAKSLTGEETSSTITNTGAVMGTPLYMSPEMITGDVVDARSDLYSLGCVLYEMCTGRPPFIAENSSLLLSKHISEQAQAISRTELGPLPEIIEQLLQKRAERRPASAAEVTQLLTRHTEHSWSSLADHQHAGAHTGSDAAASGVTATTAAIDHVKADAGPARKQGARVAVAAVIVLLCGGLAAMVFAVGRGERSESRDAAAPEPGAKPIGVAAPDAEATPEPLTAPEPGAADAAVMPDALAEVEPLPDADPVAAPKDKKRPPRKHRKRRRPPEEQKPDVPFL